MPHHPTSLAGSAVLQGCSFKMLSANSRPAILFTHTPPPPPPPPPGPGLLDQAAFTHLPVTVAVPGSVFDY